MRKKRRGRGFITVFVTLIMVPVVVCTGTMVDVARLKLYSSQAAMAADAYGEVVLSEYDNLLKELYGLFSVTQNKEGLQAIEDFQKYTKYSFAPNGDNEKLQGFMPYENAKVEVSYTNIEGASLSNNNVLMTQISDFMKFRVIEEIMGENDILATLEKFDTMSADMAVVNERNKITKSGSKALEKIGEYFEELECINDYPGYLNERKTAFEEYSAELKAIYESEEYAKYVNYINNKEAIDAAKACVENGGGEEEEEPSSEDKALAEQYVDAEAYKDEIDSRLGSFEEGLDSTTEKIEFGKVEGKVDALNQISKSLQSTLNNLEEQIQNLERKLEGCSEDVKGEIEEEIRGLKEITDKTQDFQETVNLLYNNHDPENDEENKELWETEKENLEEVKENLKKGEQEACDWKDSIEFEWYDFQTEKSAFYAQLEKLCKGSDGSGGDKKAADKKIEHAESIKEDAENELSADETTAARNITETLASQLEIPGNSTEVPDLADCFSGGASFSSIGNGLIGKFLLTTYDFGMFSSRVSGIKPPEDDEENESENGNGSSAAAGSETEYFDESLTKVKMSKDVNYLYGAELEYLIGGHNESSENLNHTRNIICGVRMTTNYLSSYSIDKVNKTIKNVADAAAKAVTLASGGTAAAAEPLIRVAVSGALRMAFATLETVNDWKLLKAREEVIFYKRKLGDLTTSLDVIKNLLGDGDDLSGDEESNDIKLSYEDYMYVLMCLFMDEDTLLDRTSNLITLNVNQSQNDGDTLTNLDFKMSDTVTAIKSTCKIDEKFLIVPENFINMYLTGTDAESMIQRLDDGSYGYSVIRGY